MNSARSVRPLPGSLTISFVSTVPAVLTFPAVLTSLIDSLTNRLDVGMSYANYDREIHSELHVQLEGWPEGVPFATPSALGAKVRILHKSLSNGDCKWVRMKKSEVEELNSRLKKVPPKERSVRSDKGKKRGKRAQKDKDLVEDGGGGGSDTGGEATRPAKKARQRNTVSKQVPPAYKSRSVIESDDEDSEE